MNGLGDTYDIFIEDHNLGLLVAETLSCRIAFSFRFRLYPLPSPTRYSSD